VDIDVKRLQNAVVRTVYQDFRVALVGAVKSFKRQTSRAAFDLMTRFQAMNAKPYHEPPVLDVPVILPSGDGYGMAFDMTEKDLAVVLCCDGPVRGTFENGTAVTPGAGAQEHTYGCAVAFPGGRVSNTETPTQPANDPWTGLCGDVVGKSACVVFRRAGHPSLPGELGTTVVKGDAPVAGVRLGGDDATLGVARLTDPVAASTEAGTLLTSIATFINGLAPGTITPAVLAAALAHLGDINGASVRVVSK